MRAAPASTEKNHFDSFTTFVDLREGKDVAVVTGVWNPADHTPPDARYYVPVQNPAVNSDGSAPDPNSRALVAFDRALRGTCPADSACPTVLNTQAQVGTTWGLAYDKYRDRIFQSAFAKRFTTYGPEGGGAIYATPLGGGAPKLFAKVPDAAVTAHGAVDMRKDEHFVDVPGKESLGGIALAEDGKTLYAVSLATRNLLSFDATGATAEPGKTVPIPDPDCAVPDDWRPFAVAAHDAKLYVGGVCSAESTKRREDLKAVVYTYDGGKFTPVLEHRLDYLRGNVIAGFQDEDMDHWNPWDTSFASWDKFVKHGPGINPQPELASLAFTRDGSMILGFRDRFMDVFGSGIDPRPGRTGVATGMSGGDITMACAAPGGGYDWEGTGLCPNHGTPATNGREPAGTVEYFHGDFYDPDRSGNGLHQEAAQGSVAYVPQQQWVISTQLDPAQQVSSDGVGYYDVDTGIGPGHDNPKHGYAFVGPVNSFGKAGGLGDIAYQAANAPIQIGNLVWFDGDHNGIQDPDRTDEVPLAKATVNLLDADGKKVASTETDKAGEYYFGGVGAEYQLKPGEKYTVQFDVCTAATDNVPGTPCGDRPAVHAPGGRTGPGARFERRAAEVRTALRRLRTGDRSRRGGRGRPHHRRRCLPSVAAGTARLVRATGDEPEPGSPGGPSARSGRDGHGFAGLDRDPAPADAADPRRGAARRRHGLPGGGPQKAVQAAVTATEVRALVRTSVTAVPASPRDRPPPSRRHAAVPGNCPEWTDRCRERTGGRPPDRPGPRHPAARPASGPGRLRR